MTFGNPIWLYWTPVILILVGGLIAFGLRRRDHLLARFAAPRLLAQLTQKAGRIRGAAKTACLLLALACLGLALARPQYGVEFLERKARGLDIVFVLDGSKSMLASDLRPNRLERAKLAILDLIERLESDRVGLVVFAGRAFLQCPPTLDYAAFRESLDAVGPQSITRGGSDIGAALGEAAGVFPTESNVKVVILLTDGEDLGGSALDAARQAAGSNIVVHAIGIGTPGGEYLRVPGPRGGEEYVRDADGQPVRSRLDENTLRQIAQTTGGEYRRLGNGSLETLYDSVLAALPREERDSGLREVPLERYQWLIGAALVLLVMEMLIRRRSGAVPAATLVFLGAFMNPAESLAQNPSEPALRSAETAGTDLPPADTETSPPAGSAPELYNRGTGALQSGDFDEARRLLDESIRKSADIRLQRDALYNMGHAVNQLGEQALQAGDPQTALSLWSEAEGLFAAAAEIDPRDEAAEQASGQVAARREKLEEFLKEQDPPPGDSGESDDSMEDSGEKNQEGGQSRQEQQDGDGSKDDQGDSSQEQESGQDDSGQSGESGQRDEGGQNQGQEGQNDGTESSGQGAETESPQNGGGEEESQPQPGEEGAAEEEDSLAGGDESPESAPPGQGETSGPENPQDEGAGEARPVPGTEDEAGGGEGSARAMTVEGMSGEEARALLDALRNSEQLLPFTDPKSGAAGQGGPIRDW